MPADHGRIDLGAGQKGQHNGADAGQVVDPVGRRQAEQVAAERADDDLHEGDGNGDADRDQRGQ
jgi:hypothetical protein